MVTDAARNSMGQHISTSTSVFWRSHYLNCHKEEVTNL